MNSRLCSACKSRFLTIVAIDPTTARGRSTKNKAILFEAQRTMASLQHRTLS
jgi:hypothetical protein